MPVLGDTISTASIALADLSDVATTSDVQIAHLGVGVAEGATARITLPATASLAGGIDFGGTASLQYVSAGKIRFERPSGGSSTLEINAATGQDSLLEISENATAQWRLWHLNATGRMSVYDVPGTRNMMQFTPAGKILFDGTPDNQDGYIKTGQSAAWDGGSAAGNLARLYMNQDSGFVNGINGARGDDVGTDSAITTGATFFLPLLSLHTFASKGAVVPVYIDLTVNKPSGATYPNTYSEAAGAYCRIRDFNNKGGYGGCYEGYININDVGAGVEADAGPARAFGYMASMLESNTYASYDDAVAFGTSTWRTSGARGIWLNSAGAQPTGTGIYLAGGGGYKRAMALTVSGVEKFCIDGTTGNIGVRHSTNQTVTLGAALTIGYTADGTTASIVAADGIDFGGDVTLYRSAANTLKTDDTFTVAGAALNLNGSFNINATGGTGFVQFAENSAVPALSVDNYGRLYIRNNKLVATYRDGGTQRWYYISLTATADQQWIYSATDPA